jgi:hypothetical protein
MLENQRNCFQIENFFFKQSLKGIVRCCALLKLLLLTSATNEIKLFQKASTKNNYDNFLSKLSNNIALYFLIEYFIKLL